MGPAMPPVGRVMLEQQLQQQLQQTNFMLQQMNGRLATQEPSCYSCKHQVWRPVVGKAPLTRTAKAKPANRLRAGLVDTRQLHGGALQRLVLYLRVLFELHR